MTRVKIENHSSYEKDTESKGIISVDKKALAAYKKQRAMLTKRIIWNKTTSFSFSR